MNRSRMILWMVATVFATFVTISAVVVVRAQDKGEIKRKALLKQELSTVPGHEGAMGQVELAPGAAEGRHTHPGELFGYVQEGTLTLNVEGKPAATLKQGDSFFVPADTIHWGENQGTAPVKVLATFVVPKGKPLTTPAK